MRKNTSPETKSKLTVTLQSKLSGKEAVTVTFSFKEEKKEVKIAKGSTVADMTSYFTPSEGYEIDGWYQNEQKFDFETPVNEDITLTAEEKKKTFTVTFMVDNNKNDEKTV